MELENDILFFTPDEAARILQVHGGLPVPFRDTDKATFIADITTAGTLARLPGHDEAPIAVNNIPPSRHFLAKRLLRQQEDSTFDPEAQIKAQTDAEPDPHTTKITAAGRFALNIYKNLSQKNNET